MRWNLLWVTRFFLWLQPPHSAIEHGGGQAGLQAVMRLCDALVP
jgi:hypothetical protein